MSSWRLVESMDAVILGELCLSRFGRWSSKDVAYLSSSIALAKRVSKTSEIFIIIYAMGSPNKWPRLDDPLDWVGASSGRTG